MKTAEDHLREKGFNSNKLALTDYTAIREAMKAYALEACERQREICAAKVLHNLDDRDYPAILNAPTPELK